MLKFDSKKEAERYIELALEQRDGKISGLMVQPRYSLTTTDASGVRHVVSEYRADFSFIRNGMLVIEDAKGVRTDVYRLKARHMKAEYGIEIVEI